MHKKQILYREEKSQEASNDQHKGKEERKTRQLEIFWHYHHKEDIPDFMERSNTRCSYLFIL